MANIGIQRKLRAIFSADVQGYSRLMGDDDEYTVNTITAYRETIAQLIEKHHGRVVDALGDNILAVFDSSLNAIRSAIEIQETLKTKNEKLPDNRRMNFRIGINLGDILHQDDRIYGDGVNIAARIENLADPGGISISRGVYEQVDGKLDIGFADLGSHSVKNIKKPVNIYKVLIDANDPITMVGIPKAKFSIRRWMIVTIVTLTILIGSVGIWYQQSRPKFEPASINRMAYPLPQNHPLPYFRLKTILTTPNWIFLPVG